MENPVYIHWGSKTFNTLIGFPIENKYLSTKPKGGLWASRVGATYGWLSVHDNLINRKYESDNFFKFTLKESSTNCVIHSFSDLGSLPLSKDETGVFHIYPTKDNLMEYCIDFEECLRMGIDAIELCWFGSEWEDVRKDALSYSLYCWDCDSIVVLNPNVVEVIDQNEKNNIC